MNLILDNNIILFKSLKPIEIIKKRALYIQMIKPLLLQLIDELGIDPKYINKIHPIPNYPTYATTIPEINNGILSFNIEIDDKIFLGLISLEAPPLKDKGKSIFQHELLHCKEIINLYNSKIFPGEYPLGKREMNTTYNYFLDRSTNLWSEFYAVYYNWEINKWHEIPSVSSDIEALLKWIVSIKTYNTSKNHIETLVLPKSFFDVFDSFCYHLIQMIALYLRTKNYIYIEDYCNHKSKVVVDYYHSILTDLTDKINTYPNWLTENAYIDFGKLLFSLITNYGIKYSTSDLSDNFLFIIE